jgi:hypothetical protein
VQIARASDACLHLVHVGRLEDESAASARLRTLLGDPTSVEVHAVSALPVAMIDAPVPTR